jgi:hypothetical protein
LNTKQITPHPAPESVPVDSTMFYVWCLGGSDFECWAAAKKKVIQAEQRIIVTTSFAEQKNM